MFKTKPDSESEDCTITYEPQGEKRFKLIRTETVSEKRDRGIASKLATQTFSWMQKHNVDAEVECSYLVTCVVFAAVEINYLITSLWFY